jgi:hypothetical protein
VTNQNIIRCICIVCSFCPSSFSSSAIAIVTPQGIVLGADGESVDRCFGPCPSAKESKKIVLVQDRVALGTVGLYAVLGDAHNVPPYYFPTLVGRIEDRLPADASVSQVSEIVQEEVEKLFSWFDLYLKRGILRSEDSPGDYPIEYLIAGYQAGRPTIYSINVEVDWQQVRLKGIHRVLIHPERDRRDDFAIYGVGSKRVIRELKEGRGDLYKKVVSKSPMESHMLAGKRGLSVSQASNLVRVLLEVEAEANPEQVGPPFTIVAIPRNGPR